MPTSENAEVFRRVIESGFNAGKLEELDRWVSPDLIEHQFGGEPGLPALKEMIRELRRAFPDLQMTIEDHVTAGDKVWARLKCRGTQNGPLMGLPPTGRAMETTAVEICRFANGKLVEHWGVPDRFAAMAQLGLLPRPGTPSRST
ncbi:MAG TPA: ester cyclase [Thermoplasmata archaeon]|nr:ester cyclase [Thermoplasmata archaeon]